MKFTLDQGPIISAFVRSSHFSSDGPLGMVYELLYKKIVLDDFANGFNLFFNICGHIV